MSSNANSQRLLKNTILLYFRTFVTMLISLYTSRVTLQALGVDNFGIQNAVGGMVAMFSLLSESLSYSIIRFITVAVGEGSKSELNNVFCTAVNVQILISVVVVVAMEVLGVWFLNNKMNIPADRMYAANWVFQCSVALFVVYLLCVPYNACIIAHERMKAFAYVGILQTVLNLVIVFMLSISPFDKLITISVLGLLVAIVIRLVYSVYCRKNFEECSYHFVFDLKLMKKMSNFAGWNMVTNACSLFSTQGVNILINICFGVSVNAARGVAGKIEGIVMKFVGDFSTALHPQITKAYASDETYQLHMLICRGARMSFLLTFCLALPFLFEADKVLNLWLGIVPDYSVNMFRLSMICTMLEIIGHTCTTACNATGEIKKLSLYTMCCTALVFPLTWLLYYLGMSVYMAYVVTFVVYLLVLSVRIHICHELVHLSVPFFIKDVFGRLALVLTLSVPLPFILYLLLDEGILRLLVVMSVSVISAVACSYLFGLTKTEKVFVMDKCIQLYKKVFKRSR